MNLYLYWILYCLGDDNSGKSTIINEFVNRHPTEDTSRIPKYALSYTYVDITEEEGYYYYYYYYYYYCYY